MNTMLTRCPSPGSAQLSLALPFYQMMALASPRFSYSSEIGSSTSQLSSATVAPLQHRRDGPVGYALERTRRARNGKAGMGAFLARMPRRGRNPG